MTYLIEKRIGEWLTATVDEDDIPVDVSFIGTKEVDPTDAVFLARVTKVDSANDMAFVRINHDDEGMLSFRRAKALSTKPPKEINSIKDCVKEGDMVRVQAIHAHIRSENKSIPLTGKPKLVGRYVVVEAGKGRLNISKDVKHHAIGALRDGLAPLAENCAIIARANADSVPSEAVIAEAKWLKAGMEAPSDDPALLMYFSPLEKALLAAPHDGDIMVAGGSVTAEAKALAISRWPDLADRISQYKGDQALMEHYGVDEAIEEAMGDKIDLPSGGWISVHETPALTAIDVNMGGAAKGMSPADARRVTNMEAALASLFHMRFQNMGGLIVIDFIDNNTKGAVAELTRLIDERLKDDPVPMQHTGLSAFGLMQFNRKRKGLSLRQRKMTPPRQQETIGSMGLRLLQDAVKLGKTAEPGDVNIRAPREVINWICDETDMFDAVKAESARHVILHVHSNPHVWIKQP